MEFIQTADDILINGKSILNNKYEKKKKRICRFKGRNDLSDKDIIEYLSEEIDDYRSKINKLEEHIDKLKEEQIEDTRLEDKDVIEIISTTQFADGKPIATTMRYKYKDGNESITITPKDVQSTITLLKEMPCKLTSERKMYSCGVDGGNKDYQVISYYDNNEKLLKEDIEELNNKKIN